MMFWGGVQYANSWTVFSWVPNWVLSILNFLPKRYRKMKTTCFMQMSELAKGCVQSPPLTEPSTVSTTQGDTGVDQLQAIKEYVLQQFGPTVRRDGLLQITSLRRSKSYDLENTDSSFPSSFQLYPGDNSPKYFWTLEVIEWVIARCNKFRNKQVGV